MFVGEAPGREEDIEGLPFVGRSGKLLDRMIAAIGLDRTSAYIANVIPWRPPGNRTPTPQETQICLPFIQRQIELVNPDVLVTLGNPSTQTLLATREGIMKTRGSWFDYDTGTRVIRAMATFHPAYLLRSPSYKRMAWQDLRAIAKALEDGDSSARRRHPALHDALRRFRPHDGPADPQQRLPPGHEPFERARHFRHQAGKPLRDIGRRRADGVGCAPDHDAAGLVEFRRASAMASAPASRRETDADAPVSSATRVASCGSPATAAQPADWCAAQNCRRRNARSRSPAATSPPRRRRSRAETAWSRAPRARAQRWRPPRPSAAAADAADEPDRRPRRSRPVPTSTTRCRRRPRRDRDRTGREIRLPTSAGAMAKK